jgi:pentatricopeptide repeat protein
MAQYQTIVTAVMTNRERLDGIEVVVQQPDRYEEEIAYLQETVQESYAQMEAARGRVLELFHHLLHRLGYKKRTEMALEVVQQLEQEGHVPQAH